ncbi:hypothetical protein KY366_06315 [Candidatus Woesearchaeota archaeon]|nr:hypothetical protein [Candidatus Woesearchaeota archaeon]
MEWKSREFELVGNFIHVGDMLASAERTPLLAEDIKERQEKSLLYLAVN